MHSVHQTRLYSVKPIEIVLIIFFKNDAILLFGKKYFIIKICSLEFCQINLEFIFKSFYFIYRFNRVFQS